MAIHPTFDHGEQLQIIKLKKKREKSPISIKKTQVISIHQAFILMLNEINSLPVRAIWVLYDLRFHPSLLLIKELVDIVIHRPIAIHIASLIQPHVVDVIGSQRSLSEPSCVCQFVLMRPIWICLDLQLAKK